jgi:anti-sigma B factor antagonist
MAIDTAPALEAVRLDERTSVLRLRGDLTLDSELALSQAYAEAAADGTRVILLDFTELRYMNSGGIGLLVTVLVRARRLAQRLLAFGVSEHYRQIFDLTRLAEAIPIFGSEREALAAAERGEHA